jgi:predicted ATPase
VVKVLSQITETDVLNLVTRLVEKSLVLYEVDEQGIGRYRLLETVRQYAQQKLTADPDGQALNRRHRDYYMAMSQEANEKLRGKSQGEWLERVEYDHDNLRAAMGLAGRLVGAVTAAFRHSGATLAVCQCASPRYAPTSASPVDLV